MTGGVKALVDRVEQVLGTCPHLILTFWADIVLRGLPPERNEYDTRSRPD